MCGRFYLASSPEELVRFFGVEQLTIVQPRYNIAPSTPVVTVRAGRNHQREMAHVEWGLIPSWAGKKPDFRGLINARAESVAEKPSFRSPFKRRRCLIPASGFYEWMNTGERTKLPYAITKRGGDPFAFAGIWDHVAYPDGSERESCAIITTKANDLVSRIHDRMPVILPEDAYDSWLFTEEQDASELVSLLKPYPSQELLTWPISKEVNNPENDYPEILEGSPEDG